MSDVAFSPVVKGPAPWRCPQAFSTRPAPIVPVVKVEPPKTFRQEFNPPVRDVLFVATEGFIGIPRPWMANILDAVAAATGVSKANLVSQRRSQWIVLPRQLACYIARTKTTMSYPDIGRRLGGRDHTTIIYAVRKIGRLLAAGDPDLSASHEAVLNLLRPVA